MKNANFINIQDSDYKASELKLDLYSRNWIELRFQNVKSGHREESMIRIRFGLRIRSNASEIFT